MSTATIMAKKKALPKPPDPGPRRAVFQMKGRDAWKEWLEELSLFLRMPTSAIVDNALVQYAKSRGFDKEAPQR